jgi:hypothetical protein
MTKAALTSCRMALIPLGFAPSGRGDPESGHETLGSGWQRKNFWNFLGS